MLSCRFPTRDVFSRPLIPNEWPVVDEVVFATPPSSQLSSPAVAPDPLPHALPSPATLADMPIPPSRASSRNKKAGHIPRPRNAFMLFRSAFSAAQKISARVEHDNRHITRIIAHCWNRLSDAEKQVWRDKAALEKAQHAQRYPDYRFNPIGRTKRPLKRRVRRNGAQDVRRCEQLAEFVIAGKFGPELESAIRKFDQESRSFYNPFGASASARVDQNSGHGGIQPFRSPLLPPATSAPQQVPDATLTSQSLVHVASAAHAGPQPCNTLSALETLQESVVMPAPSPPSPTQSPDQIQAIMRLILCNPEDPDDPVLDISAFSWDQSDDLSYYP